MIRTVIQDHAKINDRVTCKISSRGGLENALLDSGNIVPRDSPAKDFIDKFELASSRQRLHSDLAVPILAVAPRLFLVLALNIGFPADCLSIGNLRGL
jgi:hypothetical protein